MKRAQDSANVVRSISSRIERRARATGLLVLALFFTGVSPAVAQSAGGFLYAMVADTTANGGSRIYGYRVNPVAGTLTALAGFPVATGGTGTPTASTSEGLVVDFVHRRVYALNAVSRSVSVFTIGTAGALTALPFSPISLGAAPGVETLQCVAVHPSGSPLITASRFTEGDGVTLNGRAYSFNVTDAGATAASGSPFLTGADTNPLSCEFSRNGDSFYTGGWAGSHFAGFAVTPSSGVLATLTGSPFLSGGFGTGAFATDGTGRLFAADVTSNVRVFTTSAGIPSLASSAASGLTTTWDGLLTGGGFYIVSSSGTAGNVGVYRINGSGAGTTLTAVSGSPFSTGVTTTLSLALDRTGTLLFASQSIPRSLTTFRVDPEASTGFLTKLSTQATDTLGTTGFVAGLGFAPIPAAYDFDGDLSADVSVYRPSTGTWYVQSSSGSGGVSWGVSTDVPVPADYDGDGRTDPAIYRPSTGTWWILKSSSGFTTSVSYSWGVSTDTPVPADYDGDGRADPAIFRTSTGVWYILQSSTGYTAFVSYAWGVSSDTTVPADYDGDGKADIAIYRPSTGVWYVLLSSTGSTTYASYVWGVSTDTPVPADYDGDGKTDVAIYRPSTGVWYILQSSTGYTAYVSYTWGVSSDIAVPADYDGDGKGDVTIYRPSTGVWYVLLSGKAFTNYDAVPWGASTDIPLPHRP